MGVDLMNVAEFKAKYKEKPIVFYNAKDETVCKCGVHSLIINPADHLEVDHFGVSSDKTKMLCYVNVK